MNIHLDMERLRLGFRLLYFPESDYIEFLHYLTFEEPLLIGTVLVHVKWSRKLLVVSNYWCK
jgi:hypothetical protein